MKPLLFIFGVPMLGVIIALAWGCGSPLDAPYCQAEVAAPEAYIVGGEASLSRRATVYVEGTNSSCSGTIIGQHTVITAYHCDGMTDILVEGVAWFTVVEDVPHPRASFPSNDIRILHTEGPLPGPHASLATGTESCYATIAQGYGFGSYGVLHEREVFEAGHLADQIFASTAIAPGDSGGPLYALTADGYLLLGVSSWGWGSAPDYEGGTGFISVPYHIEWIAEHTK